MHHRYITNTPPFLFIMGLWATHFKPSSPTPFTMSIIEIWQNHFQILGLNTSMCCAPRICNAFQFEYVEILFVFEYESDDHRGGKSNRLCWCVAICAKTWIEYKKRCQESLEIIRIEVWKVPVLLNNHDKWDQERSTWHLRGTSATC